MSVKANQAKLTVDGVVLSDNIETIISRTANEKKF